MEPQKILIYIEEHAHHFLKAVSVEYDGEKQAVVIIRKYIREGKITAAEEVILKTQLADSLKILGIGIPFALVPGASIIMPILIKVAAKHNIALMPSAFQTSQLPNKQSNGNNEHLPDI